MGEKKRKVNTFEPRGKGRKSGYRFRSRGKSRSSWSDSQVAAHTWAQRGISARCFKKKKKKGGASPQSSLPKNSYTPLSTLTLIVPSILRNFQRTSTISQTWHAPELIPAPGMWRRGRRHFYRIEFFLSTKFGKWSHRCWEGWEGSCVSPKALPSKKQDTVPER